VTLEPPRDSTIGEAFRHQVEHLTFCYWLLAHARGKGLATSALRLVARWAFDALGVKRIGLNTDPRNVASALRCRTRRLHTRRSAALLAEVNGERVDQVSYSLLPSDLAAVSASG